MNAEGSSRYSSDDPSSSPTSASGLPTAYYDRYTRNYNLGERQQSSRTSPPQNPKPASSVGTSDHLETAVENLYRMVERKVSSDLPRVRTLQSQPNLARSASNHYTPSRPSSWTSTAIHSEVSKLYNIGASTAAVPMPANALQQQQQYQAALRNPTVSDQWQSLGTREVGKRDSLVGSDTGVTSDLLLFIYGKALPPLTFNQPITKPLTSGFLFPPFWWIGALRRNPTKYRTANRYASILGTLLYAAAIVVLVFFFIIKPNQDKKS
ncbi:hypothetical protein DFS34DRAFT_636192 [Phlyctochytrium arcticum]|nr:hypothetical protein DFS34DRAFT_636192 [Phlyctochytrium arcticum]